MSPVKSKEAKTTILVKTVARDCGSCRVRSQAERVGLCSLCASMVQQRDTGTFWIYSKPILNGELLIHALPMHLSEVPRLLLVE